MRLARRRVTVRLGACHLEVLDPVGGAVAARHPRSLHKGGEDLALDHHLEILAPKPGAFAGSTAPHLDPAWPWAADLAEAFRRLRTLPTPA